MKICRICKKEKDDCEFYNSKDKRYVCKSCYKEMVLKYVRKKKNKSEYNKTYRIKHREKTRVSGREYSRLWRLKHPEKEEQRYKKQVTKNKLLGIVYENKQSRKVRNAQQLAITYFKNGVIKQQPCLICQDPNSEKHHKDYNKPLEVIWLCRKHHRRLHCCIRRGEEVFDGLGNPVFNRQFEIIEQYAYRKDQPEEPAHNDPFPEKGEP